MSLKVASVLLGSLSLAAAQQAAWAQCGGQTYTGGTTCVSGYTCSFLNSYYSQCIPGTAASSAAPTTIKTTTTTRAAAATSAAATGSAPAPATGTKYLISFGDSYSQTGYSVTGPQASTSNPLGNPAFPGYTSSGGVNYIGAYITTYNTNGPIFSYNFASGGATTDSALITPYASTVLSLVQQVQQFVAATKTSGYVKWNSSNALYSIWIGVNDVGNGWGQSNWNTLLGQIMTQYFNQVQTLYSNGARKFVFLQTPPIQYTPLVLSSGSATAAKEGAAVDQYNNAIKTNAAAFAAAHPDAKIYIVDTSAPFLKAINNPGAYGARDNTCYDGTSSCLWNNNYHPGPAIQKLVADQFAATVGNW